MQRTTDSGSASKSAHSGSVLIFTHVTAWNSDWMVNHHRRLHIHTWSCFFYLLPFVHSKQLRPCRDVQLSSARFPVLSNYRSVRVLLKRSSNLVTYRIPNLINPHDIRTYNHIMAQHISIWLLSLKAFQKCSVCDSKEQNINLSLAWLSLEPCRGKMIFLS